MQEIVVQATKYPEIVVQGRAYDYTSDIVLIVVGVLAAAAIIWRYQRHAPGQGLTRQPLVACGLIVPSVRAQRAHQVGDAAPGC